jgi:hypothetical protein
MPWGGGVFTRTDGSKNGSTVWQQEQAASVGIIASGHDIHDQDIAGGINNCVARDGSNTPTADLPMNGFQHTGVAQATSSGQYMEYAQVNAGFQPLSAFLTALAGLTTAANEFIYATGANSFSLSSITSFALTLLGLSSAPAVKGALELSQSITASGSTLTINMALGWNVELTLSANVTSVVVQNWPASGSLGRLTLDITSTGSYTMTGWPGTTRWTGGTAPTITASGKDTVVLTSADGGTNFRGYLAGQSMS